jgi:hypothetical protein
VSSYIAFLLINFAVICLAAFIAGFMGWLD